MDQEKYGVIYPVLGNLIDRFFEGKTIFVKYLPRKTEAFQSGMKLLLYLSGGPKTIVGEAVIEKSEFMPLREAFQRYTDKIFITKEEALEYAHRFGDREEKDMLLLHLKDIREYQRPTASTRPVTMSGLYIDKKEYESIIQQAKRAPHDRQADFIWTKKTLDSQH